ncbi:hypothetical protein TRVA0_070S00232 [Trichomonascus vanleenenianus]|uniref:Fmc1p n=1 Tax=Trichomonascus vanleenenianus TaxID=2268995 RepID=UPI003ECACEC7
MYSMASVAMTARILYRNLYRELSFQHVESHQIQSAVQKEREGVIAEYRRRKAAQEKAAAAGTDASVETTGLHSSRRLKQAPLYDTAGLREAFAHAKVEDLAYGYEVLDYLRSQRRYKELFSRYNEGASMEDQERIRLSARRVGLELPKQGGPLKKNNQNL